MTAPIASGPPKTIGVAGCGTMGLPMAECLLNAGIEVWGFDVRPSSEFGAFQDRMVEDAQEFAHRCDAVISVVRDTAQTDDLLFGAQAILSQEHRPRTIVISSTLSPRFITDLAPRMPGDVALVDAPMSGAPFRAAAGTLTFMVGGEAAAVAPMMPLFHLMGDGVHHLGGLSAGMACKVLNNFVGVTGVVAVRKALASAALLGIDEETLLGIMSQSSGSTWYGDNLDKIDWARQGYDPANTIGIIEKDVRAYLDAIGGGGDFEAELLDEIRTLGPLEDGQS